MFYNRLLYQHANASNSQSMKDQKSISTTSPRTGCRPHPQILEETCVQKHFTNNFSPMGFGVEILPLSVMKGVVLLVYLVAPSFLIYLYFFALGTLLQSYCTSFCQEDQSTMWAMSIRYQDSSATIKTNLKLSITLPSGQTYNLSTLPITVLRIVYEQRSASTR